MSISITKREVNKLSGDSKQVRYSERQRYQAVALYRLLGSVRATATHLNMPLETLQRWRREDWWGEYEIELRVESKAQLSGKLGKIVEKAIKIVEDRVENGDFIWNHKSQTLERRPLGGKVANDIMKDSIDRQMLVERMQQEIKSKDTEEKFTERLLKLAEEFKKFANMKTIEAEVVTLEQPNKD